MLRNKNRNKTDKTDKPKVDAAGRELAKKNDIKEINKHRKEANKQAEENGNKGTLSPLQTPAEQGKNEQSTAQDKPEKPEDNFKGQLTVNDGATAVNELKATAQEPDKDRVLGQSVDRAEPEMLENEVTGKELTEPFTPHTETVSVLGMEKPEIEERNEAEMLRLKEEQKQEFIRETTLRLNEDQRKLESTKEPEDSKESDALRKAQKEATLALTALHRNRLHDEAPLPPPVEQQDVSKDDMTPEQQKVITPFKSVEDESGNQERITVDLAEDRETDAAETEKKEKQGQDDSTKEESASKPALNEGEEGTVNTSVFRLNDAIAFNNIARQAIEERQKGEALALEEGQSIDERKKQQLQNEHTKEREQFETAAQSRIDEATKAGDEDDKLLNGSIHDITGKPLAKDVIDAIKTGQQASMIGAGLLPANMTALAIPEPVESLAKTVESPNLTEEFDSSGSIDNTKIQASDLADGGSYEYEILDETGRGIGSRIKFQKGDPRQERNGVTTVDVLNILIHHLKSYQKGDLKNEFTATAIDSIKAAKKALDDRKKDREKRDVLYSTEK